MLAWGNLVFLYFVTVLGFDDELYWKPFGFTSLSSSSMPLLPMYRLEYDALLVYMLEICLSEMFAFFWIAVEFAFLNDLPMLLPMLPWTCFLLPLTLSLFFSCCLWKYCFSSMSLSCHGWNNYIVLISFFLDCLKLASNRCFELDAFWDLLPNDVHAEGLGLGHWVAWIEKSFGVDSSGFSDKA